MIDIGISVWHLLLAVVVAILLFGGGKLSVLRADLAKGVAAFKRGLAGDDKEFGQESGGDPPKQPTTEPLRQTPNNATRKPTRPTEVAGSTVLGGSAAVESGHPQDNRNQRTAFLCYRRDDSAYAASVIFEKLESILGTGKVFKDVDSMPYGVHFPTYIEACLKDSRFCLVIIGRNWLKVLGADGKPRLQDPNDHVRLEIETAFRERLVVIPLFVDNALPPSTAELPDSISNLAHLNGIAVRPGPDLNMDIQRLAKILS
jgi:sec-independent protein translocase protein TatA